MPHLNADEKAAYQRERNRAKQERFRLRKKAALLAQQQREVEEDVVVVESKRRRTTADSPSESMGTERNEHSEAERTAGSSSTSIPLGWVEQGRREAEEEEEVEEGPRVSSRKQIWTGPPPLSLGEYDRAPFTRYQVV